MRDTEDTVTPHASSHERTLSPPRGDPRRHLPTRPHIRARCCGSENPKSPFHHTRCTRASAVSARQAAGEAGKDALRNGNPSSNFLRLQHVHSSSMRIRSSEHSASSEANTQSLSRYRDRDFRSIPQATHIPPKPPTTPDLTQTTPGPFPNPNACK